MSRTRAAAAVCALLVLGVFAARASAARVTVLGRGGHVHIVNNPFLPGASTPPASLPTGPTTVAPSLATIASGGGSTSTGGAGLGTGPGSGGGTTTTNPTPTPTTTTTKPTTTKPPTKTPTKTKAKPKAQQITVLTVLTKLRRQNAITAAQAATYVGQWNAALNEEKHLGNARRTQLTDVTVLLHDLAAGGQMNASRLPVLFLTLQRNAQWWKQGSMLSYGQRVQFAGSELVWEYYPGQGIQLQVLGTFGEGNGYYESGAANYPKLVSLLGEMVPLAVHRGGGIAWEYYFDWDGGTPPWVSAMAQATAIEALTNAYKATNEQTYLQLAHEALPLFSAAPPTGVGVRTYLGRRYLQYSFAPGVDIINAFLQTLIGLDDYAAASQDATAEALFTAGDIQAQAELPAFNTGSWSLYQPGLEDTLSYHQLVTGFLQTLCGLTTTPIFCTTATAFQSDATTPPVIAQLTQTAAAKHKFVMRFRLSKISKVGLVISTPTGTLVSTSAQFGLGVHSFAAPALKQGTYAVKLSATDLAGNYATVSGSLTVSPTGP